MRIGGLLKFSLIDYPGRIAAVVFTQGCNFRCPYCHNPELVLPERYGTPIEVDAVMDFLGRRRGQLQGVVITGGEPTLHPGLVSFCGQVKELGFLVKLDTNGSSPAVLRELIDRKLVDFVAMDVKASPRGYHRTAGVPVDMMAIRQSIAVIQDSGVSCEFRTTAVRGLLAPEDVPELLAMLGPDMAPVLRRGNCRGKVLDPERATSSGDYSPEEWQGITRAFSMARSPRGA